jgi:hypothetical protein
MPFYHKSNGIDTHCYGCVFNLKETIVESDGAEVPEQIGCKVGRLEQYEDNGVTLIEACNEEENYYIIPDKICSMYRPQEWVAKHSTASTKELEKLAEEEVVGRMVDIIVLVNEYEQTNEVVGFLNEIEAQTMKPAKVHLMVRANGRPPSFYITMLSKYTFQWQFHHIVDPSMSYGDIINRVGDKCNSYYYAVFSPSDFFLPTDFVEKLFDRTYRQLKGFSLAEPVDIYSGLIVQSKAHKLVRGNGERSAADKIKEMAAAQKLEHVIINYEDLYN